MTAIRRRRTPDDSEPTAHPTTVLAKSDLGSPKIPLMKRDIDHLPDLAPKSGGSGGIALN